MGTGVRKLAGWCQRHPQKLLSRAQHLLSGHFSHVHVATLLVIRRRQRVLQRSELVVHKYGEELCGDVSAYLTAFLPSLEHCQVLFQCISLQLSCSFLGKGAIAERGHCLVHLDCFPLTCARISDDIHKLAHDLQHPASDSITGGRFRLDDLRPLSHHVEE